MIQPDATLPPLMPNPNKFNLFRTIIISLSIGLIVCIALFYFPVFESNHRLAYIFVVSFVISFVVFLLSYIIYIQRVGYINQWNLERDELIKEKIKLKKRTVNVNLIFTMTAMGTQGNSLFALTGNSLLMQTEKSDKSITKVANIPMLSSKSSIERFTGVLDYFLLSNVALISNIVLNEQVQLIVLDNIKVSYKKILIKKINELSGKNISNQIRFLPADELNMFINKQANVPPRTPIFLLGIQINEKTSYCAEAVILLEISSDTKEYGVNIHQSPENPQDYAIENVLSFSGDKPYVIENIWYSSVDEFKISQVVEKLATLGISPQPNMVNINSIFGETNGISDLLLISLALEQTKKSKLPQLILNTENMHGSRIISNSNY